jgi:hypothetical protein
VAPLWVHFLWPHRLLPALLFDQCLSKADLCRRPRVRLRLPNICSSFVVSRPESLLLLSGKLRLATEQHSDCGPGPSREGRRHDDGAPEPVTAQSGSHRPGVDADCLCYWYAGPGSGELIEPTGVANASDAAAWRRLRMLRVRIRTPPTFAPRGPGAPPDRKGSTTRGSTATPNVGCPPLNNEILPKPTSQGFIVTWSSTTAPA